MRGSQFARYWLPVILWMALIFSASTDLMSTHRTSRIIGPVLRWFNPDISDETIRELQFFIRKTAHVMEYAVLAVLVWRARRKPQRNDPRPWEWSHAGFAFVVAALYAASDELHQAFQPTRQGSIWDVLLDSCGAAAGLAILWLLGRWRKKW